MTLVKGTLETGFREIFDEKYSSFKGFPETFEEAVQRWASVVDSYGSKVTPTSTSSPAAKAAFISVLSTMKTVNDLDVLDKAIVAYGVALAPGMLPAFTGTPPPTEVGVKQVETIGLNNGTSEACAKKLADLIDAWFKKGTAVNTTSGATIFWS